MRFPSCKPSGGTMRYSFGSAEKWSFFFSLSPTLDPLSNSIEYLLKYIVSLSNSLYSPFMTYVYTCNSLFSGLLNSNISLIICFLYNKKRHKVSNIVCVKMQVYRHNMVWNIPTQKDQNQKPNGCYSVSLFRLASWNTVQIKLKNYITRDSKWLDRGRSVLYWLLLVPV